jgi:hypothetical protein
MWLFPISAGSPCGPGAPIYPIRWSVMSSVVLPICRCRGAIAPPPRLQGIDSGDNGPSCRIVGVEKTDAGGRPRCVFWVQEVSWAVLVNK